MDSSSHTDITTTRVARTDPCLASPNFCRSSAALSGTALRSQSPMNSHKFLTSTNPNSDLGSANPNCLLTCAALDDARCTVDVLRNVVSALRPAAAARARILRYLRDFQCDDIQAQHLRMADVNQSCPPDFLDNIPLRSFDSIEPFTSDEHICDSPYDAIRAAELEIKAVSADVARLRARVLVVKELIRRNRCESRRLNWWPISVVAIFMVIATVTGSVATALALIDRQPHAVIIALFSVVVVGMFAVASVFRNEQNGRSPTTHISNADTLSPWVAPCSNY